MATIDVYVPDELALQAESKIAPSVLSILVQNAIINRLGLTGPPETPIERLEQAMRQPTRMHEALKEYGEQDITAYLGTGIINLRGTVAAVVGDLLTLEETVPVSHIREGGTKTRMHTVNIKSLAGFTYDLPSDSK